MLTVCSLARRVCCVSEQSLKAAADLHTIRTREITEALKAAVAEATDKAVEAALRRMSGH